MLTSNQILSISGEMKRLAYDIRFVIAKAGYQDQFACRKLLCGYQITPNGLYLLGCLGRPDKPHTTEADGWHQYPFYYDENIIASIIEQWLENATETCEEPIGSWDGCAKRGYLINDVWGLEPGLRKDISKIHSAILAIRPYQNFYAK